MREMKKSQSSNKASGSSTLMLKGGPVANRLANLRKKHGLSQAELAKQVGITRQAVYAIEANQYLPSTQIALQLAGVLNCQIEDIFSLQEREAVVDAELIGGASTQKKPMRVKLAQVGLRMLARPMAELGDILNFVMSADGLILEDSNSKPRKKNSHVAVKLLHSREVIEQNIVIAGCDPALFLAGEHVRKINALSGVTNWTMGSVNALKALQRGEVHMAGLHLVDMKSGQSNIPYLKLHARNRDLVGVHFASWVQGFLIQSGNPKRIRSVQDLIKPGVRLINREAGAGARFFLDGLLEKAGMTGEKIKGYHHEVMSHLEVARHIRDGMADVGIGVETAAHYFGLDFIPLREERYDLIMRTDFLKTHSMASKFLDAVVSQPFRREIEALGGYNLNDVGKILEW
jgi:molybdate-binding protein/DNA-binding XRE family transcriptional regulator